MNDLQQTKILSRLSAEDFVGRSGELDKLLRHSQIENGNCGLLLLSAPATGATELLRQTYDHLFFEQGNTIPFYFSVNQQDKTGKARALRFLHTLLLQTVAFRRNDAKLLSASPGIYEIAELAAKSDAPWIDRLVSACEREIKLPDDYLFVRNCLSAPLRAAAHGARIFVMIDDLQNAENHVAEVNFIEELKEIYSRSSVQFVFAGRRRYVLKASQSGGDAKMSNTEILRLNAFSSEAAEMLIEKLSEKYRVKINDQTRDLVIRQFDSNPLLIESLFIAANQREIHLDSFQTIQQVYVEELFGGGIGKYYDAQFYKAAPDFRVQTRIIRLLHNTLAGENKRVKNESWQKHFRISDEEFYQMLRRLHTSEIINSSSDKIDVSGENLCLKDYIDARHRLEILSEQRAFVVGDYLSKSLKRASDLMMRFYRRQSATGLSELLAVFNCQSLPASLLDYARFKENYRGAPEAEILGNLETETEKITLPQIIYSANSAAFYPPLGQVADEERSAVGLGFRAGEYSTENEIAWIAAEIDSKLEASRELVEFWCDRLEMMAVTCNFAKYQMWLVTTEGFSPEALEILKKRKAFGSNRQQVKWLVKHLKAEDIIQEKPNPNEYEMIVPMGEDTEMIAAHAVEEIARRHDFQPKAITQIKTALVEACINATEHSLSPDRKIYQKFTVEPDKIIITISNRGIKIPSEKVAGMTAQIEPDEGRRGWGLKLMRTLMDEVKFEQVDDGTRISMVKYLK